MWGLLIVGPKFTRPARRAAAAAIDQYLPSARARPQQQTRPTAAVAVDRRKRQTDGRTLDRFMTLRPTADYADSVITVHECLIRRQTFYLFIGNLLNFRQTGKLEWCEH